MCVLSAAAISDAHSESRASPVATASGAGNCPCRQDTPAMQKASSDKRSGPEPSDASFFTILVIVVIFILLVIFRLFSFLLVFIFYAIIRVSDLFDAPLLILGFESLFVLFFVHELAFIFHPLLIAVLSLAQIFWAIWPLFHLQAIIYCLLLLLLFRTFVLLLYVFLLRKHDLVQLLQFSFFGFVHFFFSSSLLLPFVVFCCLLLLFVKPGKNEWLLIKLYVYFYISLCVF